MYTVVAETAERNLIGSVLIDNELLAMHELDGIQPEWFYSESNRVVWKHVLALYWSNRPIDLATVVESLRASRELDRAGGAMYLVGLADLDGIASNALAYAQDVKTAYEKRQLELLGAEMQAKATGATPPDELVAEVEKRLASVMQIKTSDVGAALEYASRYADGEARLPTGFVNIDTAIGGLPVGDLTVIAARTSMGKSALIHRIAFNVGDAYIMSPDQPLAEIMANEASRVSGVPLSKLRRGYAKEDEKEAWLTQLKGLRQLFFDRVRVHDKSLTIRDLEMHAKRAAKAGHKLIVLDSIQRVRTNRHDRRNTIIDVTGILKDVARDYNVCVVALSQLSRSIDFRPNRRPTLGDLSESKTIEEDANLVMLMYRESYYNPETSRGNLTELEVAKDKTGERNLFIPLLFDPTFVTFTDARAT